MSIQWLWNHICLWIYNERPFQSNTFETNRYIQITNPICYYIGTSKDTFTVHRSVHMIWTKKCRYIWGVIVCNRRLLFNHRLILTLFPIWEWIILKGTFTLFTNGYVDDLHIINEAFIFYGSFCLIATIFIHARSFCLSCHIHQLWLFVLDLSHFYPQSLYQ